MASHSGIDPRYAAQYQRGFDPARHDATPPEPPADRVAPVRLEGGRMPTAPRVPEPPSLAERGVPAAPVTAQLAVAPVAAPAEDTAVEVTRLARPRTEWAVLVAAAVQFVVAGWLFSRALDLAQLSQGVGPTAEEHAEALAANALPGPLLVGGVVALCIWIVLRALRSAGSS